MGLDTVEIIIACEEKFKIKITDKMARGMYTVGDLFHGIIQLLDSRDFNDDSLKQWKPDEVWTILQELVVEQLGANKEEVTKEARFVEDLKAD